MNFYDMQEKTRKAENGDSHACYEIAEYFYAQQDYSHAFTWYQKACEYHCSNPNVYFNLGYAYQYGEGTEKDMFVAFAYYQKAVEMNHRQAILNLSFFYDAGLVVQRDKEKADELCRQATKILLAQQNELHDLRKQNAQFMKQQEVFHKEMRLLKKDVSLLQEYYDKAMLQIQDMKTKEMHLKQRMVERESVLRQKIEEQESYIKKMNSNWIK